MKQEKCLVAKLQVVIVQVFMMNMNISIHQYFCIVCAGKTAANYCDGNSKKGSKNELQSCSS